MKTVKVDASRKYCVAVGDVLGELKVSLGDLFGDVKYALIIDENVDKYHGEAIRNALFGLSFSQYILPSGENVKNLTEYGKIIDFLVENRFSRSDVVIAAGGGVTGDIAGFAAATFLRGIRYVQLPTTLLSMTDSSVGGKTAVNTAGGKNLIGAFHQPSLVLCHTPFLDTLPVDVFADGMAEVIKYGVIRDGEFFEKLRGALSREEMIARCVEIKRDVVVSDEKERGERVILNFGHTAAHAIEKLSGYTIPHGRAVAAGMVIAAGYAETAGVCEKGTAVRIAELIKKYGVGISCPYTAGELADAAGSDKKTTGNKIKLVLPKKIGKCTVKEINTEELEAFFDMGVASCD